MLHFGEERLWHGIRSSRVLEKGTSGTKHHRKRQKEVVIARTPDLIRGTKLFGLELTAERQSLKIYPTGCSTAPPPLKERVGLRV